MDYRSIIWDQRKLYRRGVTKNVGFREKMLKKMLGFIVKNEREIEKALYEDLGKSSFESYATEISIAKDEIKYALKNIRRWTKTFPKRTPITHFPARSCVYSEPYGVVLIVSPWNYPFNLSIVPLALAIAAGNCVVLKPSARAPKTSKLIDRMIKTIFSKNYVYCALGGRNENKELLDNKFDKIFFTGSAETGKLVLEKAARNLTPVTLELGGKSPCIIDKNANIKKAARRIAWGKFLNAGQTCVAPDYVLCHESRRDEFLRQMKIQIKKMYGKNPLENDNYPKLVDERQYRRVISLIKNMEIYSGGTGDMYKRKIEPTILTSVTWDDLVMKEEIFGPVLPVMTFFDIDEVIKMLSVCPKPLATYLFTNDKNTERKVIKNLNFGGGCVNDVLIHVASKYIPFGGVNESGMGRYHGKYGFDAFSHEKSIVRRGNKIGPILRTPPYGKKVKILRKII